MRDPKEKQPQPPFAKQAQESPGSESEMAPKPDYGLDSYHGLAD